MTLRILVIKCHLNLAMVRGSPTSLQSQGNLITDILHVMGLIVTTQYTHSSRRIALHHIRWRNASYWSCCSSLCKRFWQAKRIFMTQLGEINEIAKCSVGCYHVLFWTGQDPAHQHSYPVSRYGINYQLHEFILSEWSDAFPNAYLQFYPRFWVNTSWYSGALTEFMHTIYTLHYSFWDLQFKVISE